MQAPFGETNEKATCQILGGRFVCFCCKLLVGKLTGSKAAQGVGRDSNQLMIPFPSSFPMLCFLFLRGKLWTDMDRQRQKTSGNRMPPLGLLFLKGGSPSPAHTGKETEYRLSGTPTEMLQGLPAPLPEDDPHLIFLLEKGKL